MTIKKLLCKYCSENNDHKTVTAGSIIDSILKSCAFILFAIILLILAAATTLMVVNPYVSTQKEAISSILYAWGTLILVIACLIGAIWIYMKAHELEITRCERDE